jgi:hypothetical protein
VFENYSDDDDDEGFWNNLCRAYSDMERIPGLRYGTDTWNIMPQQDLAFATNIVGKERRGRQKGRVSVRIRGW